MSSIFLDFETRSTVDLKKAGVYAYAEDPTTIAICCYLEHSDGWRVIWTPEPYPGWTPPPGVIHRWGVPWLLAVFSERGLVVYAHNSEFDAAIAEITYGMPTVTWIDTMALAMYMNFPAGLDELANTLWGEGKNKAGYTLMMKLCKPQRGVFIVITHEHLTALTVYNIRDVWLMKRFWDEYAAYLPSCEEPVFFLHQKINKGGMRIDIELARNLSGLNEALAYKAAEQAQVQTRGLTIGGKSAELTVNDLTRRDFLLDWFNRMGQPYDWSVDALDEETMQQVLGAPDERVPAVVKMVAECRLAVSRSSLKKLDAATRMVSRDGRLRGQYSYLGAHPGRWSSRGMQVHNLPRPHPYLTEEDLRKHDSSKPANGRPQAALVSQLIAAARQPAELRLGAFLAAVQAADAYAKEQSKGKDSITTEDAFTSLVRTVIIPAEGKVLVGADFAQVEGRGAAWEANDIPALEAYRAYDAGTAPHVYAKMATVIFGRTITKKDKIEYQVGKVSELGATYGMGPDKFDAQNHDDLAAAGVDAKTAIYGWRNLHRTTVKYWRELELAMKQSIRQQRERRAGPFVFDTPSHGRWTNVHMPVGRMLTYHQARYSQEDPSDDRFKLSYRSFRKGESNWPTTWGGTLLENLTQGFCRDLLADKMISADHDGLSISMHTHDELQTEVDPADANDVAAYLEDAMTKPPAWAAGFPLKGEASVMIRYGK